MSETPNETLELVICYKAPEWKNPLTAYRLLPLKLAEELGYKNEVGSGMVIDRKIGYIIFAPFYAPDESSSPFPIKPMESRQRQFVFYEPVVTKKNLPNRSPPQISKVFKDLESFGWKVVGREAFNAEHFAWARAKTASASPDPTN